MSPIRMDYAKLADETAIAATARALAERNIEPHVVATGEEALAKIKEWIPKGASVMSGTSRTLEEVGFLDYLRSDTHSWNNLRAAIVAEKDSVKQAVLRRQAALSDYYLGSVHALAQTGEFVVASATGSQMPGIVFTSPSLIFVVGAQKIVPTLPDALARVEEYVVPLEDERMKAAGYPGTVFAKEVIFRREPSSTGRKVRMILVRKKLGF